MTADDIRQKVDEAIASFGRYLFSDKGAREVMDLAPILTYVAALPPEEARTLLRDVLESKEPLCEVLVSELVADLDGQADDWWDTVMADPKLAALY